MTVTTEQELKDRQTAYKLAFSQKPGEFVMTDLAKFCRAEVSCFHPDPRMHAVLEGRREVWLRIQQHLRLPLNELMVVLGGKPIDHSRAYNAPDELDDDL